MSHKPQQQYEDVLVTQMHSLWIDEPTTTVPKKRKSLYNLLQQESMVSASLPKSTDYAFEDKQKKKRWLNKLNHLVSQYNRPAGKTAEDVHAKKLLISTPFDFNHLGHVSDHQTFGVDKLFDLGGKEKDIISSMAIERPVSNLNQIDEEEDEDDDPIPPLVPPKRSPARGVCSFPTMPIENSMSAKYLPRSASEKSVNSSLLFSRSNSVNTTVTTVSPNSHSKGSSSGNSLKSLLELEKAHQRSLSNGRTVKSKSISSTSQSSYLDQFRRTSEIVIQEEDDESLNIPQLTTPEMKQYQFPRFKSEFEWDSTMATRSLDLSTSWLDGETGVSEDGETSESLTPTAKTHDLDNTLYSQEDGNSSLEDAMEASFKAGSFTRTSRLSILQKDEELQIPHHYPYQTETDKVEKSVQAV